ncbi:MAG: hypothetical protein AABX05_01610 [Nanoarchaeota archaeon]
MGVVQEFVDLIGKVVQFCDIVYEYQAGLYIRNGIVRECKRKRLSKEEKEEIKKEEKKVRKQVGITQYLPFFRPTVPEGYRKSWVAGAVISNKRYSKILDPGFYVFIPWISHIHKDSGPEVEKVINLGTITVPSADESAASMMLSCNLKYNVENLYLAYKIVHNYEDSL